MRHRILAVLAVAAGCFLAGCGAGPTGTPAPPEIIEGSSNYEFVFNQERIVEVALVIDAEDLARIYDDPFSQEYVRAQFTYDGVTVEDVGVRLKGNLQVNFWVVNGGHKFAFKVDFNRYVDDQEFKGLTKLNLHCAVNDPSFLRENVTYNLLRDAELPASRAAYVHLTVNGEDHGLYNAVEQVDKRFLADRFDDNDGDLFKPIEHEGLLEYRGDSPDDYLVEFFGLETDEDAADYTRILELIRIINHPDEADFTQQLEAIFDVDRFLRFLAVNTFIINMDSYAELGHNYYLYDDPDSGRFVFIPWDMTEAFGNFACWPDEEGMFSWDIYHPMCAQWRPLISSILGVQGYRDDYLGHLESMMAEGGVLEEQALTQRLEDRHEFIDEAVESDPARFYTYEEFLTNLSDNVTNQAEATAAPPEIFGMTRVVEYRTAYIEGRLEEPWPE